MQRAKVQLCFRSMPGDVIIASNTRYNVFHDKIIHKFGSLEFMTRYVISISCLLFTFLLIRPLGLPLHEITKGGLTFVSFHV